MVEHVAPQQQHDAWLRLGDAEPVLGPGRRIIDPHHHLWDKHPTRLFQGRYMLEELAADTGSGHNVVATCYMQSSSAGWLRRAAVDPSVPAAAAVAAATAGRVVGESEVAQGLASMAETGKYGPALVNAGIVGTVDLEAGPDVVRAVVAEHRRAARNFRGVRFRGGKAETIDWTLPAVRGSVAALAELGASLDCNGPETHPLDFAGVLGGIADVAEANPTLTVIVDHCGGAMGPTCLAEAPGKRQEWADGIARLARIPNVAMKVGGLQMSVNGYPIGREGRPGIEGRDAPVTSEELAEMTFGIYSHVIEAFGPDRCMFESNFPVDKWGVSYRVLWNTFKRVADRMALLEPARDALFYGTARRIYRLEQLEA